MREEIGILELVAAIGSIDDIMEIRRIALEGIRKLVWFDTANFWLYPPLSSSGHQEHVVVDTPLNSLNTYLQHYANLDEFHSTYNKSDILIARSTELLDYSRWTKLSEYYFDFLKSNSVYYLLAFDIKDRDMTYGAICFHREKNNGDFTERDVLILNLVYPHLVNRLRWHYEKQALLSKLRVEAPFGTFDDSDCFKQITVRERVIVQQVLSGASNQEIAKNLGLSVNTVKMHLQNVFVKLRIKRRSQLFSLISVKHIELL